MSEANAGILVLMVVAVVCAVLRHWRIRRYVIASLFSSVVASLVFQAMNAAYLGYMDPFAAIAFVMSLLFTVPTAFVIGLWFAWRRKARRGEAGGG